MASTTRVTHRCGHQADVQIYGPVKGREAKRRRLALRDCPACFSAARTGAGLELAQRQAATGLPLLVGSTKQIAWAADIRARLLEELEPLEELARGAGGSPTAAQALDAIAYVRRQADARWWIDRERKTAESLLRELLA